jgi:hypothetical protein
VRLFGAAACRLSAPGKTKSCCTPSTYVNDYADDTPALLAATGGEFVGSAVSPRPVADVELTELVAAKPPLNRR